MATGRCPLSRLIMVEGYVSAVIDLPFARSKLVSADRIIPYLRRIDASRWYSNNGPLCVSFQERLATFWGLKAESVALTTNATVGITLALNAHGIKPGLRCLMPSWTFVASAAAVTAAHLLPSFVDVLPDTWCPDPDHLEQLAKEPDVGAILIVVPFGAPVDLSVWDALAARVGKPVIIDAAAAFDTLRHDGPMPVPACTTVVSLHATKVFGVGEGGVVLSRDTELAERVRLLTRFGFNGGREAMCPGGNAKLSEYTAAVGLAGLDEWSDTRADWLNTGALYHQALPQPIRDTLWMGPSWATSTLSLRWPGRASTLASALASKGIGSVAWWGQGCHAQKAYAGSRAEPLPVTTQLGQSVLGLPFMRDMSTQDVERVSAVLIEEWAKTCTD
ncbi:DegT/DnrJ/EryC1/StrS family aminotransferase [Acetobacter suratthaniensis]|nr:DegT/DnrJ/EryC1/StrS family aminotransferase [Acetobacter suratthaniensis]MCX2565010.1 DegT/DnrJ/EryC1/StrS family aminotransferase [Acetobacter suratthaniensis]